jgi:hypothetical protein
LQVDLARGLDRPAVTGPVPGAIAWFSVRPAATASCRSGASLLAQQRHDVGCVYVGKLIAQLFDLHASGAEGFKGPKR